VNGAVGRTNLPRKAENQEEEDECINLCIYVTMYVCMYFVCTVVCMYVCMYVCMRFIYNIILYLGKKLHGLPCSSRKWR